MQRKARCVLTRVSVSVNVGVGVGGLEVYIVRTYVLCEQCVMRTTLNVSTASVYPLRISVMGRMTVEIVQMSRNVKVSVVSISHFSM